jgi:hypothetical protein
LALARLIPGWQDVREMNVSENQFSITPAAPMNRLGAKSNFCRWN